MKGHELYIILTFLAICIVCRHPSLWYRKAFLVVIVLLLGFMRYDLPSIHCIVEGFFVQTKLAFLKKPMVIKLIVAFGPSLLMGRIFCGFICPKGAVQELVFLRRFSIRMPRKVDAILRLIPYLSLGALIIFPLLYNYRFWTDFDPFLWIFQGHGHLPGLILLAFLVLLSTVLLRPFCRYLCPLVPLFRLLSRIAPYGRMLDPVKCRSCRSGVKSCDFDIIHLCKTSVVADKEPLAHKHGHCQFDNKECIHCGRCSQLCPKKAID